MLARSLGCFCGDKKLYQLDWTGLRSFPITCVGRQDQQNLSFAKLECNCLTSALGYWSPISVAPMPKSDGHEKTGCQEMYVQVPDPVPISRIFCTLSLSKGAKCSFPPMALVQTRCIMSRRSSSRFVSRSAMSFLHHSSHRRRTRPSHLIIRKNVSCSNNCERLTGKHWEELKSAVSSHTSGTVSMVSTPVFYGVIHDAGA